jgi:hypothetical protein
MQALAIADLFEEVFDRLACLRQITIPAASVEEALWKAIDQFGAWQRETKAQKTEEDLAEPAPKIRLVES